MINVDNILLNIRKLFGLDKKSYFIYIDTSEKFNKMSDILIIEYGKVENSSV